MLISLIALWAFAAYVTVQAGLNLLWINTLDQEVGRPTDRLVTALQAERRISVQLLGHPDPATRAALTTAREETDTARTALSTSSSLDSVHWAANPAFTNDLKNLLTQLSELSETRGAIDAGQWQRRTAAASYTMIIDTAFRLYDQLGQYASQISGEGRTVVALSRARELLTQEDALLAGALAAGAFAPGDVGEFAKIVGAQRLFYSDEIARLNDADRVGYDEIASEASFQGLRGLEDQIIARDRDDSPPLVTSQQWRASIDPVLAQLRRFELDLADRILQRAKPAAVGIVVRLVLAGGLGLVAVVASIVVSIITARRLVRQLQRLRNAALELANQRLPSIVDRLQHGERVDVAAEAPPLDFGADEIGQVGRAFNTVQETAVRVAVEQAELRRGVRDVFLSLARRSQALLHRQLGLLDTMERRTGDSEVLADLFRVDHLATRMRRNAENLIVLSGAAAGRVWRKPVPITDVLRGAVAEVEDYTRVQVLPVTGAALAGRAVGDVIHLLAELIENAVSFSPPQTVVRVSGARTAAGLSIEIEDRGLGLSPQDRQRANLLLRDPPEFRLSSNARLGHFVVGQLAKRHGIDVSLTASPYGGVSAVVLLPARLISTSDDQTGDRPAGDHPTGAHSAITAGPTIQLAGRGEPTVEVATNASRAGDATDIAGSAASPVGEAADLAAVGSRLGAAASAAAAVAAVAAPAAVAATEATTVRVTPAGLPWRQRATTRSSAIPTSAQPLSAQPATLPAPRPAAEPMAGAARAPDVVRSRLSSYRLGTLRGRTDAARLSGQHVDATEWADPEANQMNEEGQR